MGRLQYLMILAVVFLTLPAQSAFALDTWFSGPRALGMGGANIASVNDTNAQYYNPAAFGFMDHRTKAGGKTATDNNDLGRKNWGFDVNAEGGIRMQNEFGDYLDTLAAIDYKQLSDNGIQSESDLVNLIKLLNGLNGLQNPGNAITADANAGLGIRAGHFAIGGHAVFQAAGRVLNVDTTNLGITNTATNIGDLNNQITNAVPVPIDTNTYQRTLITGDLYTQLSNAGLTEAAIDTVDSQLAAAGVSSSEVSGFVSNLEALTTQTLNNPNGTLSDNTTTVALRGFAMAEVPLSYGYALNDHWAVGANLKFIKGRVYGTQVLVFDKDSGQILSQVTNDYNDSNSFGLDIGIMGRYHMFNFGLVGRNLNAPKFDGFDKDITLSDNRTVHMHANDVRIDPQFAVGVAFIPFETLTLEADCDLTSNQTLLSDFGSSYDYKTQNLSAGLEWNAFHFLALRAGIYKNLAESDIGPVYTAGLGLNLWLMRFDLGAAIAGKTSQYNGSNYPREFRVAGQLSMDF